ncbi:MAG: nucleotidyltransferase family protein [Thermovirgaceae bacterium]|nr:nucleotidyltransferase family protein [Thermovirgaceae bacterium]
MAKKRIVGIIAEYNPFHNGHLYHMERAVETTGAESVVVVLSSSFVQRGEPAFTDKWSRTEMALSGGASLVIELPVAFSCHNAGVFGAAAVDLLDMTGIVTHISFGMEEPDAPLGVIAETLLSETVDFRSTLKRHLGEGYSYAEARALAAEAVVPGAKKILSSPNNILAQEYVTRIMSRGYDLLPVPVKRIGEGYHGTGRNAFASASWVRRVIRSGELSPSGTGAMPAPASAVVEREISSGRCVISLDLFWRILGTVIVRENREILSGHAEMREGMENLLAAKARSSLSFDEFVGACTSKRYPRSRIQRHAAHVLLGFDHITNRTAQRIGPPYIRVLGWDSRGQELLRIMRSSARVPIVFHPRGRHGTYQRDISDLEYRASRIWENLIPSPDPYRESRTLPVKSA